MPVYLLSKYQRSSSEEKKERILLEADYIISNHATVRNTALNFCISKSCVYKDMTTELKLISFELYKKVCKVFSENKATRHIKGGESMRLICKANSALKNCQKRDIIFVNKNDITYPRSSNPSYIKINPIIDIQFLNYGITFWKGYGALAFCLEDLKHILIFGSRGGAIIVSDEIASSLFNLSSSGHSYPLNIESLPMTTNSFDKYLKPPEIKSYTKYFKQKKVKGKQK